MKKVFCSILAALLLFGSAALADIDLSGMSYEELLELQTQVTAALWASDAWQEVIVPVGIYKIGRDIPAGTWTIKPCPGQHTHVVWSDKLDAGGASVAAGKFYEYASLDSETYHSYKVGDPTDITWTLLDGTYFQVKSSSAVFTPPAGLGFTFK